jgi:hypothetical protein
VTKLRSLAVQLIGFALDDFREYAQDAVDFFARTPPIVS